MLIPLLSYLAAGALSGLLAGLFGIGGGLVAIPFLAFALPYMGFAPETVMHVAVATSLANIVVTSCVSIYAHHQRQSINWTILKQVLLSCIIGATLGGMLVNIMPSTVLQIIFGLFVFFIAYAMLTRKKIPDDNLQLPQGLALYLPVTGIAAFCSLLGMGGGSLMVPYLSHYGLPLRKAVGTSSACGLFIALAGLLCLMISTEHISLIKPWMSGYLYWPAFLCMSAGSILFTPLGAKLTHTLPVPLLKRGFALFLIVVGISMIYKVFLHFY